jgi:hypothetical protein
MTSCAINVPSRPVLAPETAVSTASRSPAQAEFPQVAEADGNRTRQRRSAPLAGFEDRGAHQVPRRLRRRHYPQPPQSAAAQPPQSWGTVLALTASVHAGIQRVDHVRVLVVNDAALELEGRR